MYDWIDVNGKVYARCTWENRCECLENGEPSIEDCMYCASFEWCDQEDNGGEDKENVGREV
jgi:hypothetical protein